MTTNPSTIYGLPAEEWQAVFRLGIVEFAAARFAVNVEGDLVRIAFGNFGPPTDEKGGRGAATYTHAVSVPRQAALELSKLLRDLLAKPTPSKA